MIPPACCAGADHGGFLAQRRLVRHHAGGSGAVPDAWRVERGLRANGADLVLDFNVHVHIDFDLDVNLHVHIDPDVHFDFDFDIDLDFDFDLDQPDRSH
jgi:hypothetical protein